MLATINPTMKAITVFITGVLLAFLYDPITPFIYLIFTILVTFLFGNISIKRWFMLFTPFVFLSLGFAWMTMLYSSSSYAGGEVFLAFLCFELKTEYIF